mgnify:CR=1 FL=1
MKKRLPELPKYPIGQDPNIAGGYEADRTMMFAVVFGLVLFWLVGGCG